MKTLLFGTSYSTSLEEWETRYKKWLNYYENSPLNYQKLLLIDDGSDLLPNWEILNIQNTPFTEESPNKCNLIHFNNHLGRPSHLNYPGWFRSFRFAIRYAKLFNYDKIIHIETDAYVLSKELFEFINKLNDGWSTLFCKKHNFPETAIQIIGKKSIDRARKTVELDYNTYFLNRDIERAFPFTNIITKFEGDRYFEYTDKIPDSADYACQVPNNYVVLI